MYLLTILMAKNGETIKTENRKAARAIYELSLEKPDELSVEVVYEPKPKPVKFKGLAAPTEKQPAPAPKSELTKPVKKG
ncbi:hypothetical protein ES708_33934 [subsurface metagenome]